jgi:proteasome subunit alpha 4 (EC:3.4.25.1)
MTYDESVEIATVSKYLADIAHQFTQYGGVRPNGVSMIIAGIDQKGEAIYVVDPSGTYVQFTAVAIGAGADEVNSFLEKIQSRYEFRRCSSISYCINQFESRSKR